MTRPEQPVPPEWQAWNDGLARCPYCEGLGQADFASVCDCWQYEREFKSAPMSTPPPSGESESAF